MIPNCSSRRMTHEWDVFCLVARPDGSTQSKRRGSTTKGPAGKTNPNDLLPRIDHKSSRCRGQEPHTALSPRHQHHGDFAAQQRRPKRNGDFTCPTALKPRYAAFQDVRVHGCWDASGHHPSKNPPDAGDRSPTRRFRRDTNTTAISPRNSDAPNATAISHAPLL